MDLRNARLSVSLFAGKVIHSLAGPDGPQGVLHVPENDRIVVANSEDSKIRVFKWHLLQLSHVAGQLTGS
jgi:hypothetical protein